MKSNRFFALLLALAMLLSMSALAESVTLTDMTGHEITIDEPVTRIVVLQPSDAEILCALGAQDPIAEPAGGRHDDNEPDRRADCCFGAGGREGRRQQRAGH